MTEYIVDLDKEKVATLGRIWRQDDPSKLVQALFEWAYHYYVEEEDELISGKVFRRRTEDLETQVADLKRKLSTRQEKKKEDALCPRCFSTVTYDTLSRDYVCGKCGWEGPPEEVVRREPDGGS